MMHEYGRQRLTQTLGPKILTAVESGKVIEVHPAMCVICRKPLGMGLVLFEGALHYTLGCHGCKIMSLYRPDPPGTVPKWMQEQADADNN